MRLCFAVLGLAVIAAPALAGPRQDMLAGIARCNAVADERQFLDCVYGAAQPVRAELGLPPASPAQQRLVPPASMAAPMPAPRMAAAPAHSGGFNLFGDSLQMTAYSFDRRGLFTVTLSDGSVWKQKVGDSALAHFGGKASNYSVSITTSDAGINRMTVRGEGGPYLVERQR